MLPSQRVQQILEELSKQWNPPIPLSQEQYQYMKLQAVINYLDNDYLAHKSLTDEYGEY